MGDRHTLAQKLLNGYHSKVMELLIDYLQDEKICERTERTMYNRGFGGKQKRVNESVNVPGSQRSVNVSAAVDLTWRRPGELTTDEARFYVVPKALLDSDVALAADESMEHQFPSDVQEAASPQGRYQPGFVTVDESDPAIPPRAPTAPMYSYQPSFMQPQPEVQRTYDRMSAMQEAQRIRGHEPPAHSAQTAPAILGRPNHATLPIASQAATSGQLQVRGFWGTTPISISFNPEESGEQFFQAFLRWAKRRGRGSEVDRSRMMLWLKANKDMSDDAAQDVSLDLDELENLWDTTVAWIHENKSAKAPHLYATVQMIEMEDG
ncbi:uncharacterized protein J4E87_010588 [Alternaria ethzedia]|uniref:uncharacterized protein n=1 Tax=Alternaria ethzedia TaxID=181014 RepID=UPI0020C57AF4|nr:uncharacterized protein J4E87_010588 [Alternaria ethzedia]KAI4611069.1 hypothetical protein J4E87_010588 [Alternaria ethzedia]